MATNVATQMAKKPRQISNAAKVASVSRRPTTGSDNLHCSSEPARINRCCFVQEQSAGSAGFFWKFSKTAIDRQVIWRTD